MAYVLIFQGADAVSCCEVSVYNINEYESLIDNIVKINNIISDGMSDYFINGIDAMLASAFSNALC